MLTAPPADDHHTPLAASAGRLDRLVAEVRAGAAFREDTHFELTRVMPVMRRTVMQLGERLAQTGAIEHADDVWFLEWDEVAALADPNAHLDWRETIARRRASDAALAGAPLISPRALHPQRPSRDGPLLEGVPGGGGRRTAAVRIIRHPEEFPRLRSGEVLVCAATNPSWTPPFARAGALITDIGGPASHAAIVAREYRLPTVLATGTATATLVEFALAAARHHVRDHFPPPDTGNLSSDLKVWLHGMATHLTGYVGEALRGAMTESFVRAAPPPGPRGQGPGGTASSPWPHGWFIANLDVIIDRAAGAGSSPGTPRHWSARCPERCCGTTSSPTGPRSPMPSSTESSPRWPYPCSGGQAPEGPTRAVAHPGGWRG